MQHQGNINATCNIKVWHTCDTRNFSHVACVSGKMYLCAMNFCATWRRATIIMSMLCCLVQFSLERGGKNFPRNFPSIGVGDTFSALPSYTGAQFSPQWTNSQARRRILSPQNVPLYYSLSVCKNEGKSHQMFCSSGTEKCGNVYDLTTFSKWAAFF